MGVHDCGYLVDTRDRGLRHDGSKDIFEVAPLFIINAGHMSKFSATLEVNIYALLSSIDDLGIYEGIWYHSMARTNTMNDAEHAQFVLGCIHSRTNIIYSTKFSLFFFALHILIAHDTFTKSIMIFIQRIQNPILSPATPFENVPHELIPPHGACTLLLFAYINYDLYPGHFHDNVTNGIGSWIRSYQPTHQPVFLHNSSTMSSSFLSLEWATEFSQTLSTSLKYSFRVRGSKRRSFK